MKKHIIRILLFILLFFSIDLIIGQIGKKLYFKSNFPLYLKIRYTINNASEKILIYGSSRAQHHYIPANITRHTGLSCFNCGTGGQGLAFSYIQITEMLKRSKPDLVLLDISPNLMIDDNSLTKVKVLMPYYRSSETVKEIIDSSSEYENIKNISASYAYNSSIINILSGLFNPDSIAARGYIPLGETESQSSWTLVADSNQLSKSQLKDFNQQFGYLKQIAGICKASNVPLLIVISPIYVISVSESQVIEKLSTFAQSKSIHFADFSSAFSTPENQKFFHDNLHLNPLGAAAFSTKLGDAINAILKINTGDIHTKTLSGSVSL